MRLERDGFGLYYEVAGSGPALLLTHGFSGAAELYETTAAALARGRSIVTWDLRGHGRSDYPTDPAAYSTAHCVADMAALLDRTGASRAVLAGHSLGGFLSLEFQVAHPERVRALILIGTGPGYRSDEPRNVWNKMCERYARSFEAKGLEGGGDGGVPLARIHRDATGLAHAARGILAQHDARVIESLPAIRVPTLVVVGEHDTTFLAGSRYMAAKIPGAQLALIPNAGHAPFADQPAEFAKVVTEFLDGLPA